MVSRAYVFEKGSSGQSSLDFIVTVNERKVVLSYDNMRKEWLVIADIDISEPLKGYIRRAIEDVKLFESEFNEAIVVKFEKALHKLVFS